MHAERSTRVLRVIARMNMGGPAYHVGLLSLLDGRGYETLLVTGRVPAGEASMEEVADAHGARRRTIASLGPALNPVSDARALISLIRIVRSFRPDVVHTHTAKAGMLGRAAALSIRPRPRIVHTYHGHVLSGYFGPLRTALYRGLEAVMARFSDRLVGVSAATVDDLVTLRVAPRERFEVVPLGLELDPLLALGEGSSPGFRDELGIDARDALFVYIGRLAPIKRLDLMLTALARARELGAPARLAIVGDGAIRGELESSARRLGIADAVFFVGYRRDLVNIIGGADAGVLSSDNEGTPVSLIEMSAGGRPSAATNAGGVAEVVAPGCGRVVPRGDGDALGRAMAELAASPTLRRKLGSAAREHVRDRYSHTRLLGDIDALYRDLLRSNRPHP